MTTTSPASVDAIDRFATSLLAYGTDFAPIVEAAGKDPACRLVQALAALLGVLMDSADGNALCKAALTRGGASDPGTVRESAQFDIVRRLAAGDLTGARHAQEALARQFPRDLLAAKLAQLFHFQAGDAEAMLRAAAPLADTAANVPYALGLLAFALEENHRLEEAEDTARQATTVLRADPWAHHALAHVHEARGELDAGIAWMTAHADTWAQCNSFMYTHNWWHVALFELDAGRAEQALAIFDQHVWARDRSYSEDQAGAVSLLARLRMAEVDTRERIDSVASHVAARDHYHGQAFTDAHYAWVLGAAGRVDDVARLLESMGRHADRLPGPEAHRWQETAMPLARGLAAHGLARYDEAVLALRPVVANVAQVGGSHAQRDFFEQVWLDALRGAGHLAEARAGYRRRRDARPGIAGHEAALARVGQATGTGGDSPRDGPPGI